MDGHGKCREVKNSVLLLPIYIQPNPDPNDAEPPIAQQPIIELTECHHFGYALQWFAFAAILPIGYPFFARRLFARAGRFARPFIRMGGSRSAIGLPWARQVG